MTTIDTGFEGLVVFEPKVFKDARGYFFESFRHDALPEAYQSLTFVQDNESKSGSNVLRGLHFQAPPHAQGKLLRVVKGAIFDVVVDIRSKSKTFGQHFGIELNEQNKNSIYIPEGFAHGFCTLSDECIVQYRCTEYYHPETEMGLMWNDPDLGISWPVADPLVSEKDQKHPLWKAFTSPF